LYSVMSKSWDDHPRRGCGGFAGRLRVRSVPVSGTATSNAEATEAMPLVWGSAAIAVPGDGHAPAVEMFEALNCILTT
jgi:hypothetical protein